jgi:hypothetical protein
MLVALPFPLQIGWPASLKEGGMVRIVVACFLVGAITPIPLVNAASLRDRTLPYKCGDTVVIGSVKNKRFDPIEQGQDIIGLGLVSAELTIRKMVAGHRIPGIVPVTYVAHTYMREQIDSMFVLGKMPDGSFEIKAGQRMAVHPRLAARCE